MQAPVPLGSALITRLNQGDELSNDLSAVIAHVLGARTDLSAFILAVTRASWRQMISRTMLIIRLSVCLPDSSIKVS
jgi:hypothetical protein